MKEKARALGSEIGVFAADEKELAKIARDLLGQMWSEAAEMWKAEVGLKARDGETGPFMGEVSWRPAERLVVGRVVRREDRVIERCGWSWANLRGQR